MNISHPAMSCTQKAEAKVVVAVAWRVVVAVGRPQIPRVAVPTAATVHTVPAR